MSKMKSLYTNIEERLSYLELKSVIQESNINLLESCLTSLEAANQINLSERDEAYLLLGELLAKRKLQLVD